MSGGIDWFRWHHGTANDPKFVVVSKKAGARLGDVLAMWAMLLEAASMSDDRGHPGEPDFETIDLQLGMGEGTAALIYSAMTAKGMVAEDGRLTAWDKRQPKREDGSAERAKDWRERKKQEANANERTRTQTNAREEESREEKEIPPNPPRGEHPGFDEFWQAFPNRKAKQDAIKAWNKLKPSEQLQASILKAIAEQSQGEEWRKEGGRFVPHAATWLNGKRWLDELSKTVLNDIFAGAK